MSYDIARAAARIRAVSGFRTPDALIIATAIVVEADILVTNDRSWHAAAEALVPNLRVLLLSA